MLLICQDVVLVSGGVMLAALGEMLGLPMDEGKSAVGAVSIDRRTNFNQRCCREETYGVH